MKKGGKYVLVFGAVVIALLMVSSATAVSVVQSNRMKDSMENKSSIVNNEVYVDPNIHLTRKHIPVLIRSSDYVDNDYIKEFIQQIINEINNNGEANSDYIAYLIQNSPKKLSIKSVHHGFIITGEGADKWSSGTAYCFSYIFHPIVGFLSLGFNHFGFVKGGPIFWNAYHRPHGKLNVRIINILNTYTYNFEHKGIALGSFGYCAEAFDGHGMESCIIARSPLILIRYQR